MSKGQKKYALNVQWRAVKEGKSKYDKEVVTLLDGIDHTSDYRTLKRIAGKNFVIGVGYKIISHGDYCIDFYGFLNVKVPKVL